jgi:hypothetical protein
MRVPLVSICMLISAIILNPWVHANEQSTAPELSEIDTAWQKRQAAFSSLKFRWHQTFLVPNGMGLVVEKEEQVDLRLQNELSDLRIGAKGTSWLDGFPAHRSAYDGRDSRIWTKGDDKRSSSVLTQPTPYAFLRDYVHMLPVILAMQPLSPVLDFSVKDCVILPDRKLVDGVSCIGLKDMRNAIITRIYWLDPDRDFIVLRYESQVGGKPSIIQDVNFSQDKAIGWIPDKWTMKYWTDDGALNMQVDCVRKDFEVNRQIQIREFQIDPWANRKDDVPAHQ